MEPKTRPQGVRLKFLVILALAIACFVLWVSNSKPHYRRSSPGGRMTLVIDIERSHADPAAYNCVVFRVEDLSGNMLYRENTHASDSHTWKMGWSSTNQILLKSSDIGVSHWTLQPDGSWRKESQQQDGTWKEQ